MKLRQSQTGFSIPHLLLGLLAIGIVGFAGWRVYEARQDTQKSLDNASSASEVVRQEQKKEEVDEEAQKWQEVTAMQQGFAIRIPDGWEVTNYGQSNAIRSQSVTHKPGTPAKVTESPIAYAGDSIFRLSIVQLSDPAATPECDEKRSFKTTRGVEGARCYKKYPVQEPQGIGPYPGMESYTYDFRKDGKLTRVEYNVFNDNQYIRRILSPAVFSTGDKNQAELVDRMVKTLDLK